MTNLPDDPIDAGEARFARRVRDYANPAAVPVDHGAIAAAAVGAGGGRQSPRPARFGWLLAGAALAGVAAVAVLANGLRGPDAGATTSPPPPSTAGMATCEVAGLRGRILGWEGAAGSRFGSVTLATTSPSACRLMDYQLALVDGGGRGMGLIVGTDVLPGIVLEPGRPVRTVIQVSNYCLAATPREPVSLRLDGAEEDLVFLPAEDGSSGVPPCNGPGQPASISQQPWQVDGS